MKQFFDSRILPLTKIGNDYITTEEEIIKFLERWKGKEIDSFWIRKIYREIPFPVRK